MEGIVLIFACLFWGPLIAAVATLITWAVRRARNTKTPGKATESASERPASFTLRGVFWFTYVIVVLIILALFAITGPHRP